MSLEKLFTSLLVALLTCSCSTVKGSLNNYIQPKETDNVFSISGSSQVGFPSVVFSIRKINYQSTTGFGPYKVKFGKAIINVDIVRGAIGALLKSSCDIYLNLNKKRDLEVVGSFEFASDKMIGNPIHVYIWTRDTETNEVLSKKSKCILYQENFSEYNNYDYSNFGYKN